MKTRSIRTLIEPLVYIAFVAAFGFITTVVNHTSSAQPVTDTEIVSYTVEDQPQELLSSKSETINKGSL